MAKKTKTKAPRKRRATVELDLAAKVRAALGKGPKTKTEEHDEEAPDIDAIESVAASVRRKLAEKKAKKAGKKTAAKKAGKKTATPEPKVPKPSPGGKAARQVARKKTDAARKASELPPPKGAGPKRKKRENRKPIGLDEVLEVRLPADGGDETFRLLSTMSTMREILDYAASLDTMNVVALRRLRGEVEKGELPAGLARMRAGNLIRGAAKRIAKKAAGEITRRSDAARARASS